LLAWRLGPKNSGRTMVMWAHSSAGLAIASAGKVFRKLIDSGIYSDGIEVVQRSNQAILLSIPNQSIFSNTKNFYPVISHSKACPDNCQNEGTC
jgi:hypothetical protein